MKVFRVRRHTLYAPHLNGMDVDFDVHLFLTCLFCRRKMWRQVIKRYGQRNHLRINPVILASHGVEHEGKWYIRKGKSSLQKVQDWIDTHDGEAACLFLFSCNPSNSEIRSRTSFIVHFNSTASAQQLFRGGRLRLYHPLYGYIENNYYRLHQIMGQ